MLVALIEIFAGLVCACVGVYFFFGADWFMGLLMILLAIIFGSGVVDELGG